MTTRIGIIGAGRVGGSLGARLGRLGLPVRFGVRPTSDVSAVLARSTGDVAAVDIASAVRWAEIVFLCVPAVAAVPAAREAGDLTGKILVDCTTPVAWKDGPVLAPPPEGSVAAALAAACPGARVVKGFNVFGAEIHDDPVVGGQPADVYLASDDAEAKAAVGRLASFAGFAPVDAGPLRNAAVLENVAVLWIHLATVAGLGRGMAFKLLARTGS